MPRAKRSQPDDGPDVPEFIAPQLATLADAPPATGGWLHELKFDGYRLLVRRDASGVTCITRNGNDWTSHFTAIAGAAAKLPSAGFIIDGEAVVLDNDGRTNFQSLQAGIKNEDYHGRLFFYAFDLLWLDGADLRSEGIEVRKERLRGLLDDAPAVLRFSEHVDMAGPEFFRRACDMGVEGVVSKRAGSPYTSGRGKAWIKAKCVRRQEFVIGGWTEPEGSRAGFGALLVGARDNGHLRYMGKVGTGFNARSLRDLSSRMEEIAAETPPFDEVPRDVRRSAHWVEPRLVAEVAFTEITGDGVLRHPSFQGLREDKPARQVVVERPEPSEEIESVPARKQSRKAKRKSKASKAPDTTRDTGSTVAGVSITHPDRVLFPEIGVTKGDFARAMERLAPHMLPYVKRRPLSLIRCPQGPGEGCFFQKHFETARPRQLHPVRLVEKESSGEVTYTYVDDVEGIIALVQIGIVEIHPWGSRVDDPQLPDQVIFDLDPAPDVEWEQVLGATLLLRDMLSKMGLESFPKTSGGKGMHVYVPIERGPAWQEMKDWSHRVADDLVARNPDQLLATASKAARKGKIFVDYLRNGRGATCVGAYCPRARHGAPISTPVSWDEVLDGVESDAFTLENISDRLDKQKKDPWAGFFDVKQKLPL